MVGDGVADVGEVVGDGLQAAGIGGDPYVTARSGAEGLAQVDIPRRLMVVETLLDGGGAAVRAMHETEQIIDDGGHEHEAEVDIVSEPGRRGRGRSGARRDMVEGLTHGEEIGERLTPLGEISPRRLDLEVDVGADVDVTDAKRGTGRRRGGVRRSRWGKRGGDGGGHDGKRVGWFGK
jgi:hypothetical protein